MTSGGDYPSGSESDSHDFRSHEDGRYPGRKGYHQGRRGKSSDKPHREYPYGGGPTNGGGAPNGGGPLMMEDPLMVEDPLMMEDPQETEDHQEDLEDKDHQDLLDHLDQYVQ